ncbi:MAG: lipoprotein [Porcipelethomonas sp.]
MKKIISMLTAALLTVSLCACGDDSEENEKIYQDFKTYISENGTEEDYYIQISKTADSVNTLIEASRLGNDCAFMESGSNSTTKFCRNNTLTVISALNYYVPDKRDVVWEDFEYEGLNEKYQGILTDLLESDAERAVEKEKTGDKEMPYKVSVKYNPEELDTKSIFSNSGNFGIVNVKFQTDESFEKFSEVSVSCQYDYDGVIYLYSVTFGEPNEPDDEGKNGQRPEDIEKIFTAYKEQIEAMMAATE